MGKNIKYIELVFENCECIKLMPEMFRCLVINDIYKSYYINCYQYESGETDCYLGCKKLSLTINKKGLNAPYIDLEGKQGIIKDRLDTDITHIDIHFKDGTNEYISVPWEGEFSNSKQENIIQDDSIDISIG